MFIKVTNYFKLAYFIILRTSYYNVILGTFHNAEYVFLIPLVDKMGNHFVSPYYTLHLNDAGRCTITKSHSQNCLHLAHNNLCVP